MRISLVLLLLTVAPLVSGSVIPYDTLVAWQAAATQSSLLDFEGIAPPGGSVQKPYGGFVLAGITFTANPTAGLYINDSGYYGQYHNWGSGAIFKVSGGAVPSLVSLTFTGVTAFAIDLATIQFAQAVDITLSVGGNPYHISTQQRPSLTFWGVTSDDPITQVWITAGNSELILDNIRLGAKGSKGGGGGGQDPPGVGEVAEPATMWLMSSTIGLALLGWRRLSRRLRVR